jgi:xanthine/uracil/vitamin C permease (AzgA family)
MEHEPTGEELAAKDAAKSAAAKLFDLRIMIGGLFTLYGVMLIIYSFFTTVPELEKAAGININLWLGLGMLLLGVVFLLWARLSPVKHLEPSAEDLSKPSGPPSH